jgi:predicted transcriptional regulator
LVVAVELVEYNVSRCIQEGEMGSRRVLTLRLDSGLRAGLDKLAEATRRSRSFLAEEAIRDYVTLNRWQIEEIEKGVAEADRGEFASEREVNRVAKKWARRAR